MVAHPRCELIGCFPLFQACDTAHQGAAGQHRTHRIGHGADGLCNLSAYSASKGGLHALTRAMAIDYAPVGVRVNAVAPGTVDTPILKEFLAQTNDPQKARASFDAIHPVGRVATPRDVANVALFLASDEAAFVTGHVLVADGGFSIVGTQPTE